MKVFRSKKIHMFLSLTLLFQTSFVHAKAKTKNKDSDKEVVEEKKWKVPKVIKKLSDTEKKEICKKYKGKHISYIGKEIYRVTKNCHRYQLDLVEAQNYTKTHEEPVLKVNSKTIRALPLEEKKPKYVALDTYQKYKGDCITAGKVIYRVINGGKKAFSDREVGKKECQALKKPIHESEYAELKTLPDLTPYPAPKQIYKKIKTKELTQLDPELACKKLVDGKTYSFHSKLYKLAKTGKTCYLQELDKFQMDIRLKLENNIPKELSSSEYLSLKQKPVVKDTQAPSPKRQRKE